MTRRVRSPATPPPSFQTCLAVFLLALLPRLAFLVLAKPAFDNFNVALATAFRHQGSFIVDGVPATDYDLLYPLFLAGGLFVTRDHLLLVQMIQVAVSSLGAVLLYLLTEALTGRRAVAVLSASLYAAYPLLIWHAAIADESALLTALLLAFAYAVVTATNLRLACLAGLCLGLAILARTTTLPLLILAPFILVVDGRRAAALVCLTTAAIVVAPVALRNYQLGGSPWPTRSGMNFFIGNSRYARTLLPDYTPDNLVQYAESLVEADISALPAGPRRRATMDRALARLAWQDMKAEPFQTVWLKARYVAYFFWPRMVPSHVFTGDTRLILVNGADPVVINSPPRSRLEALTFMLTFVPILTAALLGIWRRGREIRRDTFLWAILVTFVAVHATYFPTTRYTTPASFVLLFYAAVGMTPTGSRTAAVAT